MLSDFDFIKMVHRIIRIVLLLFPTIVKCTKLEARDEKIFPNGTLVGSYQYVDAQGNQVHVKYFADGNSYSIDLRGYKIPKTAEETTQNFTVSVAKPITEVTDTLVPLKLDFPAVDNFYTIENPNNTNDISHNKQQNQETNDDQAEDYNYYDPVLKIANVKSLKDEKVKKKRKTIRKIRQTLDIFMRKIPNT